MIIEASPVRYAALVRAVVISVVGAAALAACTSSASGPSTSPVPTSSTSSSPASSPSSSSSTASVSASSSASPQRPGATSSAQLKSVLSSVALQQGELARGEQLKLYQGGDQVTGQVTLDFCGYDFTSEKDRIARRQSGVVDSAGRSTGTSNEVVAYDTAAHAARALQQVRTAAATCPKAPVRATVAGVPALTYRVNRNSSGVSSLPTSTNVLLVLSATGQGQTLHNVSVYQVHGRYLDAVYVNRTTAPSSADISTALRLATATGRRLAGVT